MNGSMRRASFGGDVLLELEALHLAAEAHGEGFHIEALDRADAALALRDRIPRGGEVLPTGETIPSPVTTTRRLLTPDP